MLCPADAPITVTVLSSGAIPAFDVERLPRTVVLVLRDTERELARLPLRGHVGLAGQVAADVAQHELQRAADRRVRAPALAEHVAFRIEAERFTIGPFTMMSGVPLLVAVRMP